MFFSIQKTPCKVKVLLVQSSIDCQWKISHFLYVYYGKMSALVAIQSHTKKQCVSGYLLCWCLKRMPSLSRHERSGSWACSVTWMLYWDDMVRDTYSPFSLNIQNNVFLQIMSFQFNNNIIPKHHWVCFVYFASFIKNIKSVSQKERNCLSL